MPITSCATTAARRPGTTKPGRPGLGDEHDGGQRHSVTRPEEGGDPDHHEQRLVVPADRPADQPPGQGALHDEGDEQPAGAQAPPGGLDALIDPVGLRAEVHQATGMVAAQLGVRMDEAFLRMQAQAYATNRLIGEVAADVVARRFRFEAADEIDRPPATDGDSISGDG